MTCRSSPAQGIHEDGAGTREGDALISSLTALQDTTSSHGPTDVFFDEKVVRRHIDEMMVSARDAEAAAAATTTAVKDKEEDDDKVSYVADTLRYILHGIDKKGDGDAAGEKSSLGVTTEATAAARAEGGAQTVTGVTSTTLTTARTSAADGGNNTDHHTSTRRTTSGAAAERIGRTPQEIRMLMKLLTRHVYRSRRSNLIYFRQEEGTTDTEADRDSSGPFHSRYTLLLITRTFDVLFFRFLSFLKQKTKCTGTYV